MKPINLLLRSCHDNPQFFQWKGYSLHPYEKEWLCREADRDVEN
jgi:hypothetical protein